MCVSRILRKRINEELDEKCIVQPGRDIPKEQYVRRRAYTKQHKAVWEAAIEKYKHVKCIFQNCHFLALSVEDMISHFGYCNGDGSFAKFTCPYCEGRVTSEKILEIHIRRSHEYEHFGIINTHFLYMGEDGTGSAQTDSKQCFNPENEFRTFGENRTSDMKVEEMEYEYGEGFVLQGSLTEESYGSGKHSEDEGVNENESNSEQEMEESILPDEQSADGTRPTSTQERSHRGDHIYSKRMGKVSNECSSNSLSVMKNNNLKHYSGPRNLTDRIGHCKVEEGVSQDLESTDESSVVKKEGDSPTKIDLDCNNSGKFQRDTVKFSLSAVQNIRRKIHQSYTYNWNQSIKTNGFARCLVATCNFISLDIFHIQNHFKTCNGVAAGGPNLCTICNSWLPSAVELSIHLERCKTYRNLTAHPQETDGNDNDVFDVYCQGRNEEEQKDPLGMEECVKNVTTVSELDGREDRKDGTTETSSKKEKAALRISDIIKLKDNGNMDINHIVQPRPVLPKDQYLRRRAYTKQHKAVWEAALEKHKYVKCIFQNCHFVAMSLEDMIYHFGYCIGDGSFARFECPHCGGRLTTKVVLDIHIKMSHPEMVTGEYEDETGEMAGGEDEILPSVEELRKLVNSKEIKTYGKHSMRSKMAKDPKTVVKCEPYEWCEGNEGPLSCVTVVLEENQTGLDGSSSGCEIVTVEPDLVPGISENVNVSNEENCVVIKNVSCPVENEKGEVFRVENGSDSGFQLTETEGNSKEDKRSDRVENSSVDRESDIAAEGKPVIVSRNVGSKKVADRVKKRKVPAGESEDPNTNENDQEKPAKKEPGKATEEKGQNNGESGRRGTQRKSKDEGGERESPSRERSSRKRLRNDKPCDNSRGEGSTSQEVPMDKQKGSKRRAEEMEENGKRAVEASPKTPRVEPAEDEGGTKPHRRRGRPPKTSTENTLHIAMSPKPIPVSPKTKRPGRKLSNEEETKEVDEFANVSEVKCAKCDFRGMRRQFSDHNFKKHVGLSWIEGDTPLDLTDERVISACVRQAFKTRKSATCEICNCLKKSALGFITHVQNCGKSEEEKEALKVTCPYCPSRVLKYSLPMHLKLSHSDPPKESSKSAEDCEVLTKRKSAIRAANKFQEVLVQSDDEDMKSKAPYAMYEKGASKFPKLPPKIRGLWKKMMREDRRIPCRRGSCLIESTTIQDARRHHFMCSELPEKSYVCQLCDYYSATEDDMKQHVSIHPKGDGDFTIGSEEEKTEEQDDEEEEQEMEKENEEEEEQYDAADYVKSRSRVPENLTDALESGYKMKFFAREHLLTGRKTRFCRQSLRMTLSSELEEVIDEGLPLSQLHTNAADWVGVSLNSAHNHLPGLEESMSFRVNRNEKRNEGSWRKLGRFEGEILEGAPIIFTGGGVLSMSWCKISCVRSFKENPRQYLAVSSSKEMRKFQDIHEIPGNLSGFIQIWDCGVLKTKLEIPKMMIGIIHDSGQVWDLSWLPVDTFEESVSDCGATRIGLLGGACQDGTIRIWSICDPQNLKSKFRLPLYRIQPKVVLQLEGGETVGCMRLAIGKAGVIVGGYANGLIGVWNLKAISSPFCKKIDETFVLKPHLSFQAHRTSITALSICPTNNRYIATSGLDRLLRLWDLECVVNPIESTVREVCLDSVWPLHWPVTIHTFEDVIRCIGRGWVKSFRNAYCEKYRMPLNIDNTCWSLSVNDWMNIICACSSRGEVKIRYMRNMFTADERFRLRTGHVFTTTDVRLLNEKKSESCSEEGKTNKKKKAKKPVTVPRTYEEAHRFFGLSFNDYAILDDFKKKNESEKKNEFESMEEYPIASVNKVCWNPNYGSFKFLAMGYQSGFVRIRQLEDIRCEEEVLRFLREAKASLSKL